MTVYTRIEDVPPLRYEVIVADPPWLFKNWGPKGEGRNPNQKYRCMGIEEIRALDVGKLAAPNCALWLWATNPMVPQAIETLEAWGFVFKSMGYWVKRTRHGKIAFGTGYVLRNAGDPFLVGTIGAPKFSRRVRSVVEGPIREHSRKPDEAYAAVDTWLPDATHRLDLFAREERPGWDAMGDEVGILEAAT